MADMQDTKKRRINRRTLGVGLIIALLFIGGGIYAWQGSVLKSSIGKAVQQEPDVVFTQGQATNTQEGAGAPDPRTTVHRNTTGISRVLKPAIHITTPNGGEVFCLGQAFEILWEAQGVDQVIVYLQGENTTYHFGTALANGFALNKHIRLPEQGKYTVVVGSLKEPAVQDSSDGFFAIQACAE